VALAKVTFQKPHILLLDEPSNHLDIDAVEALIQARPHAVDKPHSECACDAATIFLSATACQPRACTKSAGC